MTKRRKIPKPTFTPEEAERDNHRVALSDLALGVTGLAHVVSNALVAHNSGVTLEGYPGAIAEAATRVHELASHVVDLKPVVEQVWVVHHLDTRESADEFTAYANLDACRKALAQAVLVEHFSTHWQLWNEIDAWDGQSTLVVGSFRASTTAVQL